MTLLELEKVIFGQNLDQVSSQGGLHSLCEVTQPQWPPVVQHWP